MDMAFEGAHKISLLAGWVAMLEDVEGIGDVAERGTGKAEDTRDWCYYRSRFGVVAVTSAKMFF